MQRRLNQQKLVIQVYYILLFFYNKNLQTKMAEKAEQVRRPRALPVKVSQHNYIFSTVFFIAKRKTSCSGKY